MGVEEGKKGYGEMEVGNEGGLRCVCFWGKCLVYLGDVKVYEEVLLKMYLGLVRLEEVDLVG